MWLCAGEDVTSNIYIKNPDTTGPQRQGGTDLSETRADRWSGDGTDCAMAGIRGKAMGEELEYGKVINAQSMA